MDHLVSTLQGITGAGYHTAVAAVHRYRGDNSMLLQQVPAIILDAPQSRVRDSVNGMLEFDMSTTVRLVLADRIEPGQELEWFCADARKALLTDVTRGGAAMDTKVESETLYQSDAGTSIAVADLGVRVRFRHVYDDPNTPI